jgi:AraC-like DNA-binding protein
MAFLYCVKGVGWCEVEGRKAGIRRGDVVLVKPGKLPRFGFSAREPWTVHYVQAAGDLLSGYMDELALGSGPVTIWHVGIEPQITRLLNEVARGLVRSNDAGHFLGSAHALGSLIAALMQKRRSSPAQISHASDKVAEAINWMSEHLDEPLRVSGLARSAGLSPDYFSVLFRQQTGSSPREYLHLLRMHRARELLKSSALSIKEIARHIGYVDPFHFSRQFKTFEGVSPLRFRRAP